ncbi:MAG: tetratricopeptide repeat protein [Anaerolineales bacterium]|nr:tetratricopeptide repeat protein [Anaerolineales bacterium]
MRQKPKLSTPARLGLALLGLAVAGILLYQIPAVKQRLDWRIDLALTYLRGVVNPAQPVPTPEQTTGATIDVQPTPTMISSPTLAANQPTYTPAPTETPFPTPTPLPGAISLPPPAWEKQGPNNCGPASLAIYLRYYGWDGDQETIAEVVKPLDEDRNVNPEELVYFVRNHAGWLNTEFRVGGDIALLRQLLAAGFPVLIEESFYFDTPYWPNDDLWAAHYLLLTGYDDSTQTFTGQDSFHGANQTIAYQTLDKDWKIFNRVYLLVYLPQQEETVRTILGDNWDADANRLHAQEVALEETQDNPNDAYAWFNLGSNLVYFGRYGEAVAAYDTARTLGLYQRMLRYQFGPFFAYFHNGQTDELIGLTEYALQRTPNSEEALLWHGWALYRQGDTQKAITDWQKALEANPTYQDALYALNFVGASP